MEFNWHLGVRAKALITGIVGGLAGVMVDVDHIPQYLFNIKLHPVFLIQGFFDGPMFSGIGRPIHPLVLYISLAAFVCIVGLLMQYSVRSAAKSVAKSVVTTVQRAFGPVPAKE